MLRWITLKTVTFSLSLVRRSDEYINIDACEFCGATLFDLTKCNICVSSLLKYPVHRHLVPNRDSLLTRPFSNEKVSKLQQWFVI